MSVGLWRFQFRHPKLARFLHSNQHTERNHRYHVQWCRYSGIKSTRMIAAFWQFFSSVFSEFSFSQKMDKYSKNSSTEFLFLLFAYLGFLFNDCNAILSFIFWNRKNDYLIFIEKNGWKKIVKLQWPFLVDLNPEFLHRCHEDST